MPKTKDELAERRGGDARKARENGAGDRDEAADRVRNAAAGDRVDEEVPELEGQAKLELPGVSGDLDMRVGRGRPSSSTFKLRSLSLPLAPGQQIELEGRLWLLVEAEADDVGVKAHRKGRTVTARERQHVFTPLTARVLTDRELAKIGVDA